MSQEKAEEEDQTGAHSAYAVAPDVWFFKLVGDMSASEVAGVYAAQRRFLEGKRYAFLLVDLSELGTPPPDVRKAAIKDGSGAILRGTAVFGASFRMKVIARTISIARNLIYKRIDNPIEFFDTEAAAHAWLNQRRQVLEAELQSSGSAPARPPT